MSKTKLNKILAAVTIIWSMSIMAIPNAVADQLSDRPLRYQPEGDNIVIYNGMNRFNRPLYGTHTHFFVYAGDLPEFMMYLPGKGGTLWLGIVTPAGNKWLSDSEHILTRYRPGAMEYEIRDSLLGSGSLTLGIIPMGDAEGAVLRLQVSSNAPAFDLVWAFGGASGFRGDRDLDTTGYHHESDAWLKPQDCKSNTFKMTETGFELLAPCHGSNPLAGTVPLGSVLKIADAANLDSPNALLGSSAGELPILVGRRAMESEAEVYFAFERLGKSTSAPKADALPVTFRAAEEYRKSIAEQVRVNTPDPFINAMAPSLCIAIDGNWEPSTWLHGAVSWRMQYNGWRGAYAGTDFGWWDRMLMHFRAYAAVQVKEPAASEPHASEKFHLSRQDFDSVLYSRGHIPISTRGRTPGTLSAGEKSWYNMNEVFVDQLLCYYLWSGDVDFVREMWPMLTEHLAWEKRCFDPDDDGLYENFANIHLSDAIQYSGGGGTIASAYTWRANQLTARFARIIGEDPKPYQEEADKILRAINRILWMPELGWYAEYKDLLGLQLLHPSVELPTIYHAIDGGIADIFQRYQSLRYVDTALEHLTVRDDSVMVFTTNWVPVNNAVRMVSAEEVAHAALAYWQAGRRDKANRLWKGTILDGMYCSRTPGNVIAYSEMDPRHRSGLVTDHADTVGPYARALVEGQFGIVPDVFKGELLIRPGLPREWEYASIETPNVGYSYQRDGQVERYNVSCSFPRPLQLRLRVAAQLDKVASVTVDGKQMSWTLVDSLVEPQIEIVTEASNLHKVEIHWSGSDPAKVLYPAIVGLGEPFTVTVGPAQLLEIHDPQRTLQNISKQASSFKAVAVGLLGHRTVFAKVRQEDLTWWLPIEFEIRKPFEIRQAKVDGNIVRFILRNNTDSKINLQAEVACGDNRKPVPIDVGPRADLEVVLPARRLVIGTNPITVDMTPGRSATGSLVDWDIKPDLQGQGFQWDNVDLTGFFNDQVTQIFKHEYRSPRSPYCSLQIPLHGIGDWCSYKMYEDYTIDDSSIRKAAGVQGKYTTPQGVPFLTPGMGKKPNIVFISQWDNFPNEVTIPLSDRARQAYFLVAGSTNLMQSQLDNGEIIVSYTDGTTKRLALHNPTTWWPIEQDYDLNRDGFCIPGPHPPRIELGKGTKATLLDLPLNPGKQLSSLTLRALANEVVIGVMGVTLIRQEPAASARKNDDRDPSPLAHD